MLQDNNIVPVKRNLFLSFVYILFLADLTLRLCASITNIYGKDSWNITEWLINYRGGFVRRGLPGEIILWLYNHWGLSPYPVIIFLSVFAYITVLIYFVYAFRKKGYSLFLLPFIFFLGNPLINNFLIRKDLWLIMLFICTVYFSVKRNRLSIIPANLFFVIALLMHESIGFFCFPVLFLILVHQRENITALYKSIGIAILKLLPALITFFIVLSNKGSLLIASKIWESWKPVTFPFPAGSESNIPTSIDSLSWSLQRGIALFTGTLTDFYDGIYAPLVWMMVIIVIYYILINTNKMNAVILQRKVYSGFNQANISTILIFQLLSVIPLFILGCDFGRWIFYWVVSSFAIYFLVPEERLSVLFPAFLTRAGFKFNLLLNSTFPASSGLLYLLVFLLGFPTVTSGPTWQISLDGFYNSSPLIIVLKLISLVIKKCLLIPG